MNSRKRPRECSDPPPVRFASGEIWVRGGSSTTVPVSNGTTPVRIDDALFYPEIHPSTGILTLVHTKTVSNEYDMLDRAISKRLETQRRKNAEIERLSKQRVQLEQALPRNWKASTVLDISKNIKQLAQLLRGCHDLHICYAVDLQYQRVTTTRTLVLEPDQNRPLRLVEPGVVSHPPPTRRSLPS